MALFPTPGLITIVVMTLLNIVSDNGQNVIALQKLDRIHKTEMQLNVDRRQSTDGGRFVLREA